MPIIKGTKGQDGPTLWSPPLGTSLKTPMKLVKRPPPNIVFERGCPQNHEPSSNSLSQLQRAFPDQLYGTYIGKRGSVHAEGVQDWLHHVPEPQDPQERFVESLHGIFDHPGSSASQPITRPDSPYPFAADPAAPRGLLLKEQMLGDSPHPLRCHPIKTDGILNSPGSPPVLTTGKPMYDSCHLVGLNVSKKRDHDHVSERILIRAYFFSSNPSRPFL